jgi:hypothetical protein
MGLFSKDPKPRPEQVNKIVKGLEAEDRIASGRGGTVHGDTSLARAGATRMAAERNATPAERAAAQRVYNRRNPI